MPDSPDNIQWHPAFYAATGLELKENMDELQLIPEYNLSKEPIRIDLLVMKDKQKKTMIKNEIGHIMKTYNIIEYKSPEDGMSIDDFYKTLGYAGLYKGLGEHVGEIPTNELTISMFRERYPREMIQELKKEGHEIEEKYPGIYYVKWTFPIAAQIVVTSQLSPENHSCYRILSRNAQLQDVERFLENSRHEENPGVKNNIDAVLQASVSANFELYEDIRRSAMCQALQELLKDEINEKVTAGKIEAAKETAIKTTIENSFEFDVDEEKTIKLLMKKCNLTEEQAKEQYEKYAPVTV